jgi:comEA protein
MTSQGITLRFPSLVCLLLALSFVSSVWATKKPPAHPVNLNTAGSSELQRVPGIGPSTADKILQMRKSYGAFKSVDDLLAIRGIGHKRLEKMRRYLTVGKGGAEKQTASSTAKPPAVKSPPAKPPPAKPVPPTPKDSDEEEP